MTSRNVETRIVRLEGRTGIGRFNRLSHTEIVVEAGSRYRRLLTQHGGHDAVISALAPINHSAAQRLDALHKPENYSHNRLSDRASPAQVEAHLHRQSG